MYSECVSYDNNGQMHNYFAIQLKMEVCTYIHLDITVHVHVHFMRMNIIVNVVRWTIL